MEIREAKEEELDRLVDIWLASSLESHDFIDKKFWEENRDAMRYLYLPLSESYVVVEDSIKGFFSMMGNELAALFIQPSEQGKGLGRALIQQAKQENDEIYLNVYAKNKRAIIFYENQNFRIIESSIDTATGEKEYRMQWRKTMRSEKEMFDLFLTFAEKDERIRMVTLEGSRTNPHIPDDEFKDYDLSYFVADIKSFQKNDAWLAIFGKRIILQKPEESTLYPPEPGTWYSYLMLFEDGNKVDLSLITLEETDDYFEKSDGLVEVLLDKDKRIKTEIVPTDKQYWIQKPSAKKFDDCCNEFWWVSTYVSKGLARKEFLFALDHLNQIIRPTLLLMLAWKIGAEKGYDFSLGKNYKFIQNYIDKDEWQQVIKTFRCDGYEEAWQALFLCQDLFRVYSKEVARVYDYDYPDYDKKVSHYIKKIYQQDLEA